MELLDKIEKEYTENGFTEALIELMVQQRELFLAAGDPLATKATRLAFEYIQENEDFDIEIEDFDETDEEDSFLYFIQLLRDPQNKYNREELAEYRTILKDELY